ncbi:MAG: signal transduction histidine kinase [Myxococcota bacterium]|jgi:signal transduction histidine kinase
MRTLRRSRRSSAPDTAGVAETGWLQAVLRRLRLRPRSLRFRAMFVVSLVVAAPLIFVWMSSLTDASVGWQMQRRVARAAELAVEPGADLGWIAWQRGVRLRVLSPEQEEIVDIGRAARSRGSFFFGPDGGPSVDAWDARQLPLAERPEVTRAQLAGEASGCLSTDQRQLLICYAVLRAEDGRVVYAIDGSQRAIRALYNVRYPLLKLVLFVSVLGLALGWWLGWRMVHPVEVLRDAVIARRVSGSLEPIVLDRADEFGELALAFNGLLDAIRSRDAANEAFAADLVHELKNPLAAIAAVAEVLEGGRPLDEQRAARLSRALRSSGGRLESLADQFLDLARAEAGLRGTSRDTIDLAALAEGTTAAIAANPRFRSVDFQVEAETVMVSGVPERLETALRNLLDNAACFSVEQHPDGGGTVTVQVRPGDHGALVRIIDNGPGITAEDLEKLFQRFFSRRKGGTGLGLALTRAIVAAHSGRITAASQPAAGAIFEVWLPAVEPERDNSIY